MTTGVFADTPETTTRSDDDPITVTVTGRYPVPLRTMTVSRPPIRVTLERGTLTAPSGTRASKFSVAV
jgi:hypothetical protein